MLAAIATGANPTDPVAALRIADLPEPAHDPGWVQVTVRHAALNHHDLWTLRGAVRPAGLPIILGTDAAGHLADGTPVLVRAVMGHVGPWGDETSDPERTLLSEKYPGTLAERVWVPQRNTLELPAGMDLAEAACLPTAYLTAYRMLFVEAGLRAGDDVLVQGAGGGVASAAIVLGVAAGLRVWVTSRSAARRQFALDLGAAGAYPVGERLPTRVAGVIESVGAPTWEHSVKSTRSGGTIVVCGTTGGAETTLDLRQIFARQLRVHGVMMGSRQQLVELIEFVAGHGVHPPIGAHFPLAQAGEGLAAMARGEVLGKIVIDI